MSEDAVREILSMIGEDPDREGLAKTPARVVRSYHELCAGYQQDPADILSTSFEMDDVDENIEYRGMVLLKQIEFHSLCEHHLLPFVGKAAVGYVPGDDGRVVGISKLARLVDVYARRLQCQERMTAQIADALVTHLEPRGVIVVVEAEHFCMQMRGVSKQSSSMTTSEVRGILVEDHKARAEALGLMGNSV